MTESAQSFRVVAAGDAVLLVEFEERLDVGINARVIAIAQRIREAHIPGVRDVVSTFRSTAVYFDPLRTNVADLAARLQAESRRAEATAPQWSGRTVRIPVCYGTEYGPDLDEVAAFAGVTPELVAEWHATPVYRVFMLGFVPGFAYMGPVDPRIAMPRKQDPRARVPAGSVGIAGPQTGVYPSESPGGWRLIGRTPIKPFDPERARPFLFEAGDEVRFYPIATSDFDAAAAQGQG